MNAGDRHLSLESFARYLRAGLPIEHPIPGTPRLILFFDPDRSRIGLRGPASPDDRPAGTGLENLTIQTVHHDGQRLTEIAVTESRIFTDAYPLLCTVADRVQVDDKPLTQALTETVRRLGHLLRRADVLSKEAEIGLFGELYLLGGMARTVGAAAALRAWRGGQGEEHDFGLADHDVEVKTTTSDRRAHWISSLTQLVQTSNRPLWLVSFQITGAGDGGLTLGDLVARLRELFSADRDDFDERLMGAGWRDRYVVRVSQSWRLRASPEVYAVADGFPRLTPGLLTTAHVDPAYVTDIRYRLDLTGRAGNRCPDVLATAITTAHQEFR